MTDHPASPSTRHVALIGVPTDIGASARGASMGPEALRVAGLRERLEAHGLTVTDTGNLAGPSNPWLPPVDGYRHLDEVVAWNRLAHEAVHAELQAGRLPIMLGGDHCLGIGSISAVARHCRETGRKLRVLWLDAHADFNTSTITPSGNIHGMPVAVALGRGPRALTQLGGFAPKLQPNNVVLIGLRDLDHEEKKAILDSGVHAFTMQDIDMRGMAGVMQEAISLATRNTQYLHVSFDIDSVDPRMAPGTGTTVFGGLTYREAHLALEMVAESGKLTSFEMVEVNPILDNYNMTGELACGLIASALGKRIL